MSSKSGASGSVRSCAGSVRLGTASGHEVVLDALYERKRDNKSVRVLTVLIYVFCVSLAAIMLSLYYVFFWEPKDAPYAQRKVLHTVEKPTTTTPMPTCFMPHTGGGDSGVKAVVTPASRDDTTVPTSPTDEDPTTDLLLESTTDNTFTSESLNSTYDSGTNGTDVT